MWFNPIHRVISYQFQSQKYWNVIISQLYIYKLKRSLPQSVSLLIEQFICLLTVNYCLQLYFFNFLVIAWLSSARAVKCQVNSLNERNPYALFEQIILPVKYRRKGRIMSSRHDANGLGYTCATLIMTTGSNYVNLSKS